MPGPRTGRSGGRHAAPRKSLLTKLQIPAGKAMALAAMPTAVFVGMSLTPRLAMADDKGDLPFAPGPCVTRSDDASQEPSDSASPKPSDSATPSPGATPGPSASSGAKPTASGEAKSEDAKGEGAKGDGATDEDAKGGDGAESPGATATSGAGASGAGADAASGKAAKESGATSATPSPSPSETRNPLDPLGVGDALKDLLTPKDEKTAEPSGSPSPSATGESKPENEDKDKDGDKDGDKADGTTDDPSGDGAKGEDAGKAGDAADDADGKDDDAASGRATTLKDKISEAARKSGAAEKDIEDGARAAGEKNAAGPQDPKADPTGETPDGTRPYPCPTHDAKALADADVDASFPRVADEPWRLETTKLSLHGLGYDGIVKVRTASGEVKNVLKFTASGLDIKDLHQLTVGPDGYTGHVKGAPGSTSTIRDGKVTMYTERLKGNLLGLIPVDFTPDSPPPLTLPELFFTKVTVVQAGQFGGTLHIPGIENYYDKTNG